jgi:hypothetical protein
MTLLTQAVQELRLAFKAIPAAEQETCLRGLAQEHAYQCGLEGLPLPKELEESATLRATKAEGERDRLKVILGRVERAVKGELERGYVLTHEPLAGNAWRRRWNDLLTEVEKALGR